jgi:hypothetical protein
MAQPPGYCGKEARLDSPPAMSARKALPRANRRSTVSCSRVGFLQIVRESGMSPRHLSRRQPLAVSALVLMLAVTPSQAAWGPDGVTIKATSTPIPLVTACSDGGSGTFVAWQEEIPGYSSCLLYVQHVLASGDLDPAWHADGAFACTTSAHSTVGVLPDRLGGVYVWGGLRLTRLDNEGDVANWMAAVRPSIGGAFPRSTSHRRW